MAFTDDAGTIFPNTMPTSQYVTNPVTPRVTSVGRNPINLASVVPGSPDSPASLGLPSPSGFKTGPVPAMIRPRRFFTRNANVAPTVAGVGSLPGNQGM